MKDWFILFRLLVFQIRKSNLNQGISNQVLTSHLGIVIIISCKFYKKQTFKGLDLPLGLSLLNGLFWMSKALCLGRLSKVLSAECSLNCTISPHCWMICNYCSTSSGLMRSWPTKTGKSRAGVPATGWTLNSYFLHSLPRSHLGKYHSQMSMKSGYVHELRFK